MKEKSNHLIDVIRNFSIISHVDHGKTTLSDHIIAEGGLLPSKLAGSLRALDYLPQEQSRGITIKSAFVSFDFDYNKINYSINFIDTPGHIDFSSNVAESLRIVDNALILVDIIEGVQAQTITVLRQALNEKLKLVLFINKLDRIISELQIKPAELRTRIETIIGKIEILCIRHNYPVDLIPSFEKGTVILGSALHGWGITIEFVNKGMKIDDIYDAYLTKSNGNKLPKISKLLKTMIVNKFICPQEGQNIKFPSLLEYEISDVNSQILKNCDHKKPAIILVGPYHNLKQSTQYGQIIRVLSGIVDEKTILRSSLTGKITPIKNIYRVKGKKLKQKAEIFAGNLGVVDLETRIQVGDVLINKGLEAIIMKKIPYVQESVISLKIEPTNLEDLDKLIESLELLTSITPGLVYNLNNETGELIVSGVGTLQLDVFINELKNQEFEIETSIPEIIEYLIPKDCIEYDFEDLGKLKIFAGNSNKICFKNSTYSYWDNLKNCITFEGLSEDFQKGAIETFSLKTKNSPISGLRIKNFGLKIQNISLNKTNNSYEGGMIVISKIIKEALIKTRSIIHLPYYIMELQVSPDYTGHVTHELNKFKVQIISLETLDYFTHIKAYVSLKFNNELADKLRQVAVGHIYWSYSELLYLEKE